MITDIQRSVLNNLNRIIFQCSHKIENGENLDINELNDYLLYDPDKLRELLIKIFGDILNLNEDPEVFEKMTDAICAVDNHDQNHFLQNNGFLVLINHASSAMVRIADTARFGY